MKTLFNIALALLLLVIAVPAIVSLVEQYSQPIRLSSYILLGALIQIVTGQLSNKLYDK